MTSGQVGFQTMFWLAERAANQNQFEIFSALTSYPNPGQQVNQLYGASAVSINDYFIVFGGFSYPKILATVNKYDNGKWIKLKGRAI